MGQYKFLNQHQPQTLVIATLFCYIDAVFGFLGGVVTTSAILAIVTIFGLALGGFGRRSGATASPSRPPSSKSVGSSR